MDSTTPDGAVTSPSDGGVTEPAEGGPAPMTDAGVTTTTLGTTTQSIGGAGGTISLGKASLVVPAGALPQTVSISITATSVEPDGGAPTTIYEFGPQGLTFAIPATVNLPGTAGVIHWSQVLGGRTVFTEVPTSVAGGLATAKVTHFSYAFLACGWLVDTSASAPYYACPTFNQSGLQLEPVCPAGYGCTNSPTGCAAVPATGCSGGDVWTGFVCSPFCPGASAVGSPGCPIGGLAGVSCAPDVDASFGAGDSSLNMEDGAPACSGSGATSAPTGACSSFETCGGHMYEASCSSAGEGTCATDGAPGGTSYGCVCGSGPSFSSTGGFSCAVSQPGGGFESCLSACGFPVP